MLGPEDFGSLLIRLHLQGKNLFQECGVQKQIFPLGHLQLKRIRESIQPWNLISPHLCQEKEIIVLIKLHKRLLLPSKMEAIIANLMVLMKVNREIKQQDMDSLIT